MDAIEDDDEIEDEWYARYGAHDLAAAAAAAIGISEGGDLFPIMPDAESTTMLNCTTFLLLLLLLLLLWKMGDDCIVDFIPLTVHVLLPEEDDAEIIILYRL